MNKFVMMATLSALVVCSVGARADVVGDPAAARGKVANCIGCHGITDYRTAFPEVYRVPKLGGQNAAYIATALREYQNRDRKFQTMHAAASSLTEQDIADIAAYYAAQTATSPINPDK
ncbi:c-type cytochrome [Burkholderia sp. L27(2015)]|uniref:c-type cytochrome n=1 Tax=Burkholderia sp. L27(2015) TaxID=1641858 RepID=UPI00131BCEBD|nr:c-type cytochrome [Burkholderia sp. L27(2015)]